MELVESDLLLAWEILPTHITCPDNPVFSIKASDGVNE